MENLNLKDTTFISWVNKFDLVNHRISHEAVTPDKHPTRFNRSLETYFINAFISSDLETVRLYLQTPAHLY